MKISEILENLDRGQKEALTKTDGPLLIVAGAGTGKTTVITRRIAYLIASGLAKPSEILALTFTDKAAQEMEERVDILVPYGCTDISISTFHAFGDRAIRDNALELGISPDFRVLTRPQQIVFFNEHLFEFELDYYRPLSEPGMFIDSMVGLFSRLTDEDISPRDYLEYAESLEDKLTKHSSQEEIDFARQQMELAKAHKKYGELLMKYSQVDFGNQFYLALKLFRQRPLILKRYQDKFKYILVDEFQDTNYAQFQMLWLLAAKHKNIAVTGDDDQSIYRFRGAAFSNILNFLKSYPDAQTVVLNKNYRSTQPILDRAYQLITHNNPDRLEVKHNISKQLIGVSNKGIDPEFLYFDSNLCEADEVAKKIFDLVKTAKYNYSDFAVLVRSNSDADAYLRSLNMQDVPWRFSGNQGLYQRPEIRLIISFLRAITNLYDSTSLYRLAQSELYNLNMIDLVLCTNTASRHHKSLFEVFRAVDEYESLKPMKDASRKIIDKILSDIERYINLSKELTSGRLLYKFLTDSGFIKRLTKDMNLEAEEKIQNIARFFEIVRNFEYLTNEDTVERFVNNLNILIKAGDDPATAQADFDTQAVNVMTIHKAKGLEFRVVFIVSLVSGKFPLPNKRDKLEVPQELIKDILPEGDYHIEEERRLFYVAMTRAKEELYLTAAKDYGGSRTRRLSQFVVEALGLAPQEAAVIKTSPIAAINRHAPQPKKEMPVKKLKEGEILTLSHYQIDDYLTCPLKYKYIHLLRLPIMKHHTVVYGKAMHDAILKYHTHKINNKPVNYKDLVGAFEQSWTNEGFLSNQHALLRLEAGKKALKKFFDIQEASKIIPAFVEKEFSFVLGRDRIIGRWDRIDKAPGGAVIIDFKTSLVKKQAEADKRAKESLQLGIYALAYKMANKELPSAIELHFLESGLVGRARVEEDMLDAVIESINLASRGIRARAFEASASYDCKWCAYSHICPSKE